METDNIQLATIWDSKDGHFIADAKEGTLLGIYSTKARVIEVLDEIHKGICYTKRTELYAGQTSMSDTDMMQFVFQMPAE